jgi:hypothetical protein
MILSNGTLDIEIPDTEFVWSDELDHDPVTLSQSRTITGALVTEEFVAQAGRPITLDPIDDKHGWLSRATWLALKAFAADEGGQFTFTSPAGDDHTVIFARPAMKAAPLFGHSAQDATETWRGSIYLLTV